MYQLLLQAYHIEVFIILDEKCFNNLNLESCQKLYMLGTV